MKKYLYLALAATTLAACSDVEDLSSGQQGGTSNVIGFHVQGNNSVTRATKLQEAGHYNFGVFAYKNTDMVNNVMSNYLVGYFDEDKAYQETGSTVDDKPGVADGKSYWMYENMGNTQYHGTYAGGVLARFYESNNAVQYIKYWDKSAASTCFYAYAPYVGTNDLSKRVTYVDGIAQDATGGDTYVMNIPNGTLEAGYDDATRYEYMYASKKVLSADYGHDVSLEFERLVAKVNIKFWEDVPGYKVQILDLKKGTYEGVQAAASVKETGAGYYGYRGGQYYTSNGVKIKFDNATGAMFGIKQYNGTVEDNNVPLVFKSPTHAAIGENRFDASASPTTYYAIPKGSTANVLQNTTPMAPDYDDTGNPPHADLAKTGFTFHVTYMLTAEDSGERITVHNATVHVPCDYCKWEMNKHYTYIFKITQGTNGSTDNTTDIDPKDPEVPTTPALYPIVFDNCVVADWDEDESEWNITDDTALSYHNIKLSRYSLVTGDITVTINDDDKHNGHDVNYNAVRVYGPNSVSTDVTTTMYDAYNKKITVSNTTEAGLYTVVYTCPGYDINGNHPKTWKAYFVVGNDYDVTTSHGYIGCNGVEASATLGITATKDGIAYAPQDGQLKIEYPTNFKDIQKELVKVVGTNVVVDKNAVPGVYRLVLTINEGSAVKVAEKEFEVKDYSFILSPSVVYSRGTDMKIVCSQWNSEITAKAYTTISGVTVDDNEITIPNGYAEGENYEVTYTVWNDASDGAKVTYKKTFAVRNTHEVSVPAQQLIRNVGTHSNDDYSEAPVYIEVKFNGNAPTSSVLSNLSVVKYDHSATTVGDFDIKEVTGDNGTYKLTCKAGVDPGTYYVKYVSKVKGVDTPEYGMFIVK